MVNLNDAHGRLRKPYNNYDSYIAHNRSYDSLKNFQIGAIVFFRFFRINQLNIKFKFSHPKWHFLALNLVVWRIKCENSSNGLVCMRKRRSKHSKVFGYVRNISHI